MKLEDILESKKCFKLVCGAGNEDIEEVERLVYLYSKAGCCMFDLSANVDVIRAAKKGLEKSKETQNRYLCVSLGIKGDPHIQKAEIDELKCTKCDACRKNCQQEAILENVNANYIKRKRCIGCGRCLKSCKHNAISLVSHEVEFGKILPDIIQEGVDCIEFHATIDNDNEVMEKWDEICSLYKGLVSICIDRSNLGNKRFINRIKNMIKNRKPYTTIIQADGAPMSGGKDDYKTTLQTIAAAELVQDEELPVYILLSGGTNSKTKELANRCGIYPNGIAIGSYARKIVREYISRDDFYTNDENFSQALHIAKDLVNFCL